MVRLALYFLFGLFLFAMAAGGSWFYLQSRSDLQGSDPVSTQPPEIAIPASPAEDESQSGLAVPLRGRPMGPEEAFRFGASIRNRQLALKKHEQSLRDRESRLKLIQEDIEGEKRELNGLLMQIRDSLDKGDKLLTQLTEQRSRLTQESEEVKNQAKALEAARGEYKQDEVDNVKQVSRWFQTMPPENAAEYLRELSNDGKLDSAVQLLGNIEERDVAKILVAIEDPTLVVELTERFKGLKRPAPKTRRR